MSEPSSAEQSGPSPRRRGSSARLVVLGALLFATAMLAATLVAVDRAYEAQRDAGPQVNVLAYARTPEFPLSLLLLGEPEDATIPFAWLVWLVRTDRAIILVDTGFADPSRAAFVGLASFEPVLALLADLGLTPGDVTDVILTHAHWDHAGYLAPYSGARVWIQARELEWARQHAVTSPDHGEQVLLADLEQLDAIAADNRLRIVDGTAEITDDVRVHLAGGHTPGSQWVEVSGINDVGTVAIASDNAFLFRNVEERRPVASTTDRRENVAALQQMTEAVGRPELVLPGHDPLSLEMYRPVSHRISRLP